MDISKYDPTKWVDKGCYWLYDIDQREPAWYLVRKGRPSGSNCGALIGHSNFGTPDETAEIIAGVKEKEFTETQRQNMDHGTLMEPTARDWYAKQYSCLVEEVGFSVPKWDLDIGVSIDGDVLGTDGMIEIKCPKVMYRPLDMYMANRAAGKIMDINNKNHIWKTHYDQMQLGMAVLQKKWCDYVVYCSPENKVFVERVYFDEKFWKEEMYPKIKYMINHKIKPLLKQNNLPFPLYPPFP